MAHPAVTDTAVDSLRQLEAFHYVQRLFQSIARERRYLLKVVCGGRYHWMNACEREFRGMAVQPQVFDDMWAYFVHKAGAGNLKEELGVLLEQHAEAQAEQVIDIDALISDIVRVDDGAPVSVQDGRVH